MEEPTPIKRSRVRAALTVPVLRDCADDNIHATAVPFVQAPEQAYELSEMAATTLFGLPHVLRLGAHRILSSWFGYTALKPTAIRSIAFSPVLLPVWMVDVVVKGKALLGDVQVDLDGA